MFCLLLRVIMVCSCLRRLIVPSIINICVPISYTVRGGGGWRTCYAAFRCIYFYYEFIACNVYRMFGVHFQRCEIFTFIAFVAMEKTIFILSNQWIICFRFKSQWQIIIMLPLVSLFHILFQCHIINIIRKQFFAFSSLIFPSLL